MPTYHLACLLPLVLLPPALAPPAPATPQEQQEQQEKKPAKPYKVASRVQGEIVLQDLAGKEVRIFEQSYGDEEGKLVVLVFWSLRDPMSHMYRKRLEAFDAKFAEKVVRLYLVASSYDEIFSGHGDALEKFRKFVEKEKFALPILVDHGNKIADDFGALTSCHAFVIDRQRYVRYIGAIDDDPKEKKKPDAVRHLLRDATDALLTGKKIKDPISRPAGRKIKRAPKK